VIDTSGRDWAELATAIVDGTELRLTLYSAAADREYIPPRFNASAEPSAPPPTTTIVPTPIREVVLITGPVVAAPVLVALLPFIVMVDAVVEVE
jgi:hypothetical protein